ncbi:MAG: hypothetical protein IJ727_10725 [Treponema sp.]|nr:hypothetical protein [Treponema sp.]
MTYRQKCGTKNPSLDFWIPDENFAMQNSRFPVPPHPCGKFSIDPAMLDSHILKKQEDFNELPETYIIFVEMMRSRGTEKREKLRA